MDVEKKKITHYFSEEKSCFLLAKDFILLTISYFTNGGKKMLLEWVLGFLVLALIAAILGFGGIARGAAGIAKVLFFVFLVLLIIGFFL